MEFDFQHYDCQIFTHHNVLHVFDLSVELSMISVELTKEVILPHRR